jgi:hypothetical protein
MHSGSLFVPTVVNRFGGLYLATIPVDSQLNVEYNVV